MQCTPCGAINPHRLFSHHNRWIERTFLWKCIMYIKTPYLILYLLSEWMNWNFFGFFSLSLSFFVSSIAISTSIALLLLLLVCELCVLRSKYYFSLVFFTLLVMMFFGFLLLFSFPLRHNVDAHSSGRPSIGDRREKLWVHILSVHNLRFIFFFLEGGGGKMLFISPRLDSSVPSSRDKFSVSCAASFARKKRTTYTQQNPTRRFLCCFPFTPYPLLFLLLPLSDCWQSWNKQEKRAKPYFYFFSFISSISFLGC